jgi:uncharacterized protein
LRIEISKIASCEGYLQASFAKDESDANVFEELRLQDPLQVELTVVPEDSNKWVLTGTLSGVQVLECSRTLELFDHPFETPISFWVELIPGLAEQELDDSDDETFGFRVPQVQDHVDVTECVRQLVILQEPLHPVKDDPDKAFVWEVGEKSEEPKEDPRWEKLKALKAKMEHPNG